MLGIHIDRRNVICNSRLFGTERERWKGFKFLSTGLFLGHYSYRKAWRYNLSEHRSPCSNEISIFWPINFGIDRVGLLFRVYMYRIRSRYKEDWNWWNESQSILYTGCAQLHVYIFGDIIVLNELKYDTHQRALRIRIQTRNVTRAMLANPELDHIIWIELLAADHEIKILYDGRLVILERRRAINYRSSHSIESSNVEAPGLFFSVKTTTPCCPYIPYNPYIF